jgi:D-3-phosphoglycerate dehydrogenase
MDILTLNKISKIGLKEFDSSYNILEECEAPDGIIVRSASMHEYSFNEKTLAVARAGAGVNNIPVPDCAGKGIVVFNTPGANANAVKELVVCGLMVSSRKVMAAYDWCKGLKGEGENVGKLVEKGKSQFAGPEIAGKTLGLVGLGAIGRLVADAAISLGMKVIGFDAFLADEAKALLNSSVELVGSVDEIYENSDYISLHIPATAETKGSINNATIGKMKDGVRILNFARGELVNSADLLKALESGKVSCYVTDFPTDDVIGVENVVALPHLGASTPESEENCAYMAAVQMKEFLEKGNVKNSVNFPAVSLDDDGARLSVIHNAELSTNDILSVFTANSVEVKSFKTGKKGDFAYSLFVASSVTDEITNAVASLNGVVRARKI